MPETSPTTAAPSLNVLDKVELSRRARKIVDAKRVLSTINDVPPNGSNYPSNPHGLAPRPLLPLSAAPTASENGNDSTPGGSSSGIDRPGSSVGYHEGHNFGNRKRPVFTRSTKGCLTCRKQKVKCDETRPDCLRCLGSSRPCLWPTPEQMQGRKGKKRRISSSGGVATLEGDSNAEVSDAKSQSPRPYSSHGRNEPASSSTPSAGHPSPWENILSAAKAAEHASSSAPVDNRSIFERHQSFAQAASNPGPPSAIRPHLDLSPTYSLPPPPSASSTMQLGLPPLRATPFLNTLPPLPMLPDGPSQTLLAYSSPSPMTFAQSQMRSSSNGGTPIWGDITIPPAKSASVTPSGLANPLDNLDKSLLISRRQGKSTGTSWAAVHAAEHHPPQPQQTGQMTKEAMIHPVRLLDTSSAASAALRMAMLSTSVTSFVSQHEWSGASEDDPAWMAQKAKLVEMGSKFKQAALANTMLSGGGNQGFDNILAASVILLIRDVISADSGWRENLEYAVNLVNKKGGPAAVLQANHSDFTRRFLIEELTTHDVFSCLVTNKEPALLDQYDPWWFDCVESSKTRWEWESVERAAMIDLLARVFALRSRKFRLGIGASASQTQAARRSPMDQTRSLNGGHSTRRLEVASLQAHFAREADALLMQLDVWGSSLPNIPQHFRVTLGDYIYRYMATVILLADILERPIETPRIVKCIDHILELCSEASAMRLCVQLMWPLLISGTYCRSHVRGKVDSLFAAFSSEYCEDLRAARRLMHAQWREIDENGVPVHWNTLMERIGQNCMFI